MVVTPSLQESLDSTRSQKQDVNDINDKIRLFPDQTKKEYPSDLIIIIDDKSREFEFSFPDVNDNV